MNAVRIQLAARGMPTCKWKIRCANQPVHGFGYLPLMEYFDMLDQFQCGNCQQIIKAETIYWMLPTPPKGLG